MADLVKTIKLTQEVEMPEFAALPLENFNVISTSTIAVEAAWHDPNEGAQASTYRLQFDTDPNFTNPTNIIIVATPGEDGFYGIPLPLLTASPHYFRIRAENIGGVSAWAPYTFVTNEPDELEDFGASVVSGTEIDLGWTDPSEWADYYILQIATLADFSNAVTQPNIAANPLSGSLHNVTGLTPSTTYYFRIKAHNATADSDWVTCSESTP